MELQIILKLVQIQLCKKKCYNKDYNKDYNIININFILIIINIKLYKYNINNINGT